MSNKPEKRDVNLIDQAINEMSIIREKERVLTDFNVKMIRLESLTLRSFLKNNEDKLEGAGMPDLSDIMPKSAEERIHKTLSNFMMPVPKGFKPPSADVFAVDTDDVRNKVKVSTAWLAQIRNDLDGTQFPNRHLEKSSVDSMQALSYKMTDEINKNVKRITDYSNKNIKGNMLDVEGMQKKLDAGEDVGFKSTQFIIQKMVLTTNKEGKKSFEPFFGVMTQGNANDHTSILAISDKKEHKGFISLKGNNKDNGNPAKSSQIILMTEDLHNKKIVNGDPVTKTKNPLDPIEAAIYLSTLDKNHYMDDPDVAVLLVDSRDLKEVVDDLKEVNPNAAIRFAFKAENTPLALPSNEDNYKIKTTEGVLAKGLRQAMSVSHNPKQASMTGFAVIPVSSDTSLKELSKTFYDKVKEDYPNNTSKQEEEFDKLMNMVGDKTKQLGDECKIQLMDAYDGKDLSRINNLSFRSRSDNLTKFPDGKSEPEPEPQQKLSL